MKRLLMLSLFALVPVLPAKADFSLTILHINDLHSRIEPINKYDSTCSAEDDQAGECFGGIARVATEIRTRREVYQAEGGNVLTLDAGDQFQGSLFYTTYKGAAAVEFMNDIGFDAMAVGNHEFDDGPEGLADFIDKAHFPVLSGNTDVSAVPRLAGRVPEYMIRTIGGERIGIVSVLATDTDETSSPGRDVHFEDEIAYLKRVVPEIESRNVNKIIALTHVGLGKDRQIAAEVPGIDVIVGGHSHTLLSNAVDGAAGPYPLMVDNPDGVAVPIVTAYAYSKYLGELVVRFDDAGVVTSANGDLVLLDSSVEPDPDIAERVAELAAPLAELKAQVVGDAADAINGERTACRTTECPMGNLVADAMLDRVRGQGIQVAIQNGGGLRASIDAGPVTMGEVLTVLPFQNTVATFQLKGADLVTALENGVSRVEGGGGRFPQVSGMKFTWTRAQPADDGRVRSVEIFEDGSWQPLDPDRVYGVVSNDYMRRGGDGYAVFADKAMNAYDFGPGLEQVVVDYLGGNNPYKPYRDGRIEEVE